jgi:hypothetical protein
MESPFSINRVTASSIEKILGSNVSPLSCHGIEG